MGVSITFFGNQKAVFANQDDGIFSAVPITFDKSVLTLETYTVSNREFVKAGSVVKYGTTVKGITAEEYEITDGPVTGRVALEGYVYVERLTQAAAEAMSVLPKIVPIPYGKILFAVESALGLDVYIRVSGSVWTNAVAAANLSVTDGGSTNMEIKSVAKVADDESLLKVTFGVKADEEAKDGSLTITAVAAAAVVGSTGKVIAGLPLTITFKNGEVCLNA